MVKSWDRGLSTVLLERMHKWFSFKWRKTWGRGQQVCIIKQYWSRAGRLEHCPSSASAWWSEEVLLRLRGQSGSHKSNSAPACRLAFLSNDPCSGTPRWLRRKEEGQWLNLRTFRENKAETPNEGRDVKRWCCCRLPCGRVQVRSQCLFSVFLLVLCTVYFDHTCSTSLTPSRSTHISITHPTSCLCCC